MKNGGKVIVSADLRKSSFPMVMAINIVVFITIQQQSVKLMIQRMGNGVQMPLCCQRITFAITIVLMITMILRKFK